MGLLKAMAEKPKSQYKSKNHQHCHYEDEDLCSFTHITHFFFFFLSFCFWGLLQRFELRNSESDRVCFGFVDFSKDGFDFEFGFFFVFFSWWVRENEGERERERESPEQCLVGSLAGWSLAWFGLCDFKDWERVNVAREG